MLEAVRWIRNDGVIVAGPDGATVHRPGKLRLLDQTRLPETMVFLELDDAEAIIDAIRQLKVRGAPAIGCAAALGLAAAMQSCAETGRAGWFAALHANAQIFIAARPTAVNLAWAVRRVVGETENCVWTQPRQAQADLLTAALRILAEDIDLCRAIGRNGLPLLRDRCTVLTHCNAGALATGDYGTALAPVYLAHESGLKVRVYSDETRPLLQGSRLTAWELQRAGVEVCTICDNMAAQVMKEGRIDLVIVGADRIAANGDTANKIGTYAVAIAAKYHRIPFYVAAPYSTFDFSLADGAQIPIEERAPAEIGNFFGRRTAPEGILFYNPAFDVTPHELITGFITERGVFAAAELAVMRERA